ncbi:MAG: DUF1223 domain-containing protein [Herminiimonas sp.]|nr:DUF1223 domain-containing protein [Herminiimonas sp.]
MNRLILSTVVAAIAAAPLSPVLAAACSKQSPAHTVALLELYTSEGCSSCQAADRFVSGLLKPGMTLDQVVPLSLHVDYWDYIGWKDVYARAAFTERQRWLSALAGSRTIYTPEVFVGGRESRDWAARSGVMAAVRRTNDRPAQADVAITLGTPTTAGLPVEINARAAQSGNLFIALYENGLVSKVAAGENSGTELRHDHVVRQWFGPFALSGNGNQPKAGWSQTIAMPSGAVYKNLGVAAFVQSTKGEILQSLALPTCPG